ncbi:unnamed protein product [Ceutorhynchus assimilis]|uniref:Uncharacterized protein n=1 Tax=Ceutorhynchus assimilis TaxID=467358 RepID=A0A9N9QSB1_9CUCU|nr:unnamed protein product [Ceutorhynchus assimilis]
MVEKAMAMSSDIPGTSGLEKREDTNSELQNSCDKFSDNDHLKHNIDDIEEFEDSDDSVNDFDQQEVPLPEITEAETNNTNITIVEKYKGRPKKGRKIKHEGQDRAKRKKLTNSNKQYYSAKGKLVHPKEFVEYICPCSMECHQKVSIEERRQFFDHYWNLGDYNVQTTYLSTCVREEKKKRAHTAARNPEKRQFSRQYFINKHLVCRNMFVKTLQISTKRINTSLCKIRKLSTLDFRCVAGGHNKISDEQKNSVISHINKFPRYKSHYCRMKKDKQEYLTEGTTLTVMYKFYKDENNLILWSDSCGGQNRNIKMVLLLKCAVEVSTHLKSIELRFLVSGHSFLPNHSDFGDVECVLKRQTKMYSPEDYIQVMKSCRRKHPIEVVSMEKKNFVSTKMLEKEIINRKKKLRRGEDQLVEN